MLDLLRQFGQPSCLGTLARAYGHYPSSYEAGVALEHVVERLRPEDYGTLPAETVPAICKTFTKADQTTASALINALGVIGDGRAIKAVERLMQNAESDGVRSAASLLLPILQQRAADSRSATQLLRPSSAQQAGQESLLRVAEASSLASANELLRVAVVEE